MTVARPPGAGAPAITKAGGECAAEWVWRRSGPLPKLPHATQSFGRTAVKPAEARQPAPRRGLGAAAWLGGLGLALLFVALRWNSYSVPLIRDEGEYAYAAQLLRHGQAPYESSFLQKPPLVAFSYALAGALAPGVYWAPRLLAYAFVALATLLLGLIARREFGPGAALPAMWLCTPMVLQPGLEQFTANTEMFMLLPLVGVVAVYVVRRSGRGWGAWCLAGALGALTLGYKYTAFPLLALVYAVWSVEEWRSTKNLRSLARCWLGGLLGGAVAGAAALGWFLVRDGGRHLWECTVEFNRFYAASSNFGLEALGSRLYGYGSNWWVLFLLLGVLAFRWRPRLWFWLGMFLMAWVTTGLSWYGHYYIVLMPFWALLAGFAIQSLAAMTAARFKWPEAWARGAVTAVVLGLVLLCDLPWVTCSPARFMAEKLAGLPFAESPAVGRRVAELTRPGDLVFIAGSEPQILCYARRFSPTRFVILYPLTIPTPLAAGYQQEAIAALEQHPPAVIVLARASSSWLVQEGTPPDFPNYVQKLVADHYERVGGYVPETQGGQWQEPLSEEQLANSSLVVYRRKG